MSLPVLRLRKGEDRRLRAGHAWIFSNEVDIDRVALTEFQPGQAVAFADHHGTILGTGYANPHSLICGRLVSRDPREPFGEKLIRNRINRALAFRESIYSAPFYRLVFGESDGLPGLLVDRYGPHIAVQITTAGMEAHKETTIAALIDILGPSSILFRNDLDVRSLEGLDQYIETAYGESVDVTTIIENGHDFEVRIRTGQKTGWFFDQRQNRSLLPARFVSGRRVLDVYSYTGAWAIHAAKLGAAQVVCVESSAAAIECLTRNAEINGVAPRISIVAGDASDVLRDFRRGSERFDIVILDPPAFVKRRKDLATGLAAYKSLNRLALDLIRDNGLLVTSSCSAHVSSERFQATIRKAALQPRLRVSIIARGCQGFDHPIHPAIPETEYLKCLFLAIERPDSQGKFHSSAG